MAVVSSLKEPAEQALRATRGAALPVACGHALAQRDYANALGRLAGCARPWMLSSSSVMVMDEDPRLRNNRLALLAQLHGLFIGIADLSRLPG